MKKLLQRGSYEDLSRQWQPYRPKQQNWEFSQILNEDQIQKLTTSGLIDAMKNPGKFVSFHSSVTSLSLTRHFYD